MGHYNDRDVAPAWNDFPEVDDDQKPLYGADAPAYRQDAETTKPVTDYDSKTVMLQAGRGDTLSIKDCVERFADEIVVPNMVDVVKRTATYFGPELTVHTEHDGEEYNWLLTAPGPDAFLLLWGATTESDEQGNTWRKGWYPGAEVTAYLHEPDNQYRRCQVCRRPTETIQHERESLFGICQREPSREQ